MMLLGAKSGLHDKAKPLAKKILQLTGDKGMVDKKYYSGFSKEQQERYEREISQKFGKAKLDESKRRMEGWQKEDYLKMQQEGERIFSTIRDNMSHGAESPEVQAQIGILQDWLNHYYSCSDEMLMGLGHMYNEHPDFVKMWKTKYHEKMPEFLYQAINTYCRGKGVATGN
jgi:hypothetical protein